MLSRKTLKIIIVMGGVLLIALPFISFPKAEVSDSFAGHWYVWEENVNVSGNQWISYQNVLFVTNDPTAMGQVQVNNTTSGPSNFIQTLDFSGTYTFYSHLFEQPFTLTNGLMPVATSNSRAFTSFTPIQSAHNVEIVQLSSTQIQSLISAIQNSSSYDDTTLLTQLAIIKGVLDNIDTSASTSATDIASLLNTSNSILNALNNIDNALDTISWQNLNVSIYGISNDGVNFSTTQQQYSKEYKFYFNTFTINNYSNGLLKIRVPAYINGSRGCTISNEQVSGDYKISYVQYGRMYTDIYLVLSESRSDSTNNYINGNRKFIISFGGQWTYTSAQYGIYYLDTNDIEYWQLKAFFEQHNYYLQEYPEMANEQSEFNEELDDYLDAEDALISDFQNTMSNPAISPSIPSANPSNWGNTALNSIAFIGLIFNTLTGFTLGGNVFYQLIQFSLMFGLALLIIGKRAI